MGKFILCSGKRAEEPLHIEMTDTVLYTIEELSYYLYQNVYLLADDFFKEPILVWLEQQVGKPELASKLRELNRTNGTLKDKVVSVLCSTDYYSEREMKELITIMTKIEGIPLIKRRKMKADIYVHYGRFAFAAKEYEAILNCTEASILTAEEYGNLLHNYAIVLLYIGSIQEAADKFKEAYQSNQNLESLKEYLMVLKMLQGVGKDGNLLDEERKEFNVSDELIQEIEQFFADARSMEQNNSYHAIYRKLNELKEHSDVIKFFQETESILEEWVGEYKNRVG